MKLFSASTVNAIVSTSRDNLFFISYVTFINLLFIELEKLNSVISL